MHTVKSLKYGIKKRKALRMLAVE